MVTTRNMAAALPAPATAPLVASQPQEHANLPTAPNLALMKDWLANTPSNEGYLQLQCFACAFNYAHPFTNHECNNSSKMVAALLHSFRTHGMCLTDMLLTFVWAKPESPRPPLLDHLRPLDLAAHFHTSG